MDPSALIPPEVVPYDPKVDQEKAKADLEQQELERQQQEQEIQQQIAESNAAHVAAVEALRKGEPLQDGEI
jgi:hypothetical protein